MATAEVIAIISSLVSLAGVAVAVFAIRSQGQALRRQLCVQTFTEYTRRYRELLAQVPEELLAGTVPPDLLEQHKSKLSLLRTYFDLCFEEYYLHDRGFMDHDLWLLWCGGMEFAFSRPVVAAGWRLLKPGIQYPTDFVAFVEQRLAPQPKLTGAEPDAGVR